MALTLLGDISEALENILITEKLLKNKDKTKVSKAVFEHLKAKGLKVAYEKQVGFLKLFVDIDYRDSQACVTVKLAEKLVSDTGNTGEIQRLLGQTYYYTRYYRNILPVVMVLVVGHKSLETDPKIKEIRKCIEALSAEFKYLPVK